MAYNKPPGVALKRNPPPDLPLEWCTDVQLAKRFGVSRATIWRWSEEGKLPKPSRLFGSRSVRWRLSDIEELEAQ